jgi:hypothetical protein
MGVELWYTRDGKTWRKDANGIQSQKPYRVSVAEEGVYGFILRARNGFGAGQGPPASGEAPQFWVEVDVTKPTVALTGVRAGPEARSLAISWTAGDKNLGGRPVALYYAEQGGGSWVPIATNLENTGNYLWRVPQGVPNSFRVRVEATDLAGNQATADSPSSVQIDLTQPKVTEITINTVE